MAGKPSDEQMSNRSERTNHEGGLNRRRVLQTGATAALASAAGLGSAIGAASASRGNGKPEVVRKTANPKRLQNAQPLLEELAGEGLISRASPSAFSHAPLGKNDSGSAVLEYGERVVHAFVLRSNGTKLTVNLPEGENPYALYAADGSGPGMRVHYEQVGGRVESFEMEYEASDVTTQDCGDNCGGITCSPAGNCWWDHRRCEESCVTDDSGYTYCHDDCCCCC